MFSPVCTCACMRVSAWWLVCLCACARACYLMGKSPGVLRNQNVYPTTSNAGNNKPAQWLTDPYSNSYSTPANKVNLLLGFFCFLRVDAAPYQKRA